jgi:hypothetical protein
MTAPAWLLVIAAVSGGGAYLVRSDHRMIVWLILCVWSMCLGLLLVPT